MKNSKYNRALLNHYVTPWWLLLVLSICFAILAIVAFSVGIDVAIAFSIFSGLASLICGVFAAINFSAYKKSLRGKYSHWIDLNLE